MPHSATRGGKITTNPSQHLPVLPDEVRLSTPGLLHSCVWSPMSTSPCAPRTCLRALPSLFSPPLPSWQRSGQGQVWNGLPRGQCQEFAVSEAPMAIAFSSPYLVQVPSLGLGCGEKHGKELTQDHLCTPGGWRRGEEHAHPIIALFSLCRDPSPQSGHASLEGPDSGQGHCHHRLLLQTVRHPWVWVTAEFS